MSLLKYKQKRTPDKTPEPFGAAKRNKAKKLLFVVQKHAASHLHYDFRLEAEGVLKSWAIPKGPSMKSGEKHLAVMVEDHPYDYHDFEGTIPHGNYGAGTVMVWDEGTYIPLNDKVEGTEKSILDGLKKGKLSFFLEGQKLKGRFSLVRIKGDTTRENWLFIKGDDEFASDENILDDDRSAVSGRTMDEITEGSGPKWESNKPKKTEKQVKKKALKGLPEKVHPMLATLVDEPFDGKEWLFETKWDGFRAIAQLRYDDVELYSRNFKSFNFKFAPIVEALQRLGVEAVLDGEIVVLDKKGKSSFQGLQNYQTTGKGDLHYYVFDLLYFEGYDTRDLPLIKRKELLEKLLSEQKDSKILYSSHTFAKGKMAFKEAEKHGEEGIIAKKIESAYISARSREWLKVKTHARQEAVICGFTEPRGSRKHFGALIIGVYKDGRLQYAGHVGGGFDEAGLKDMIKKLTPFIVEKCPFSEVPKTNAPVTWVKPKLIAEISFQEWTEDGRMRQPIFQGFRYDKEAKEVKKETPAHVEKATSSAKEPPLTNLDKVFWPKEGYTKGDLLSYYREAADYILPYLKDRPESLHRYPNGIEQPGFYQKNIDDSFPEWIKTCNVTHHDTTRRYMLIQDTKTLLYAVNLGCIDFNPFSSRTKNLENPDFAIFDLDPEDIPFEAVIETALALHRFFEKYDIPSFCKTSGATGMHILVPTGAKYTYEQVKLFAELICSFIHQELPDITSMERSPAKRQKKVYLDFLQNNFGQTIATPYSVRPKPHAPVSMPLEWNEVKKGLAPTDFTIENALKRMKKKGDIFNGVLGKGVNLLKILKLLQ